MTTIPPKKFSLLLRICISILLLGALFKIMHWPNANQLLVISITCILILYPIRFLFKQQKVFMDYVKLILVVTWCLNYLTKVLHIYQFPLFFNIILILAFIWWFINEGTAYITFNNITLNGISKSLYFTVIGFTFGFIFLGVVFKIQHWPFSNQLFVTGIFSAAVLLIVDYFLRK